MAGRIVDCLSDSDAGRLKTSAMLLSRFVSLSLTVTIAAALV
jgi:hypothetical protein